MFILHSSNKTENLLEHLASILKNPLSSPLSTEVFLIQSQGMERWLSQQLATHSQVYANFEFFFPGKFFSQMARQIHSRLNTDVFVRELMVWRFELLLNDLEDEVFSPLKSYLEGENSALKRFQLATNLAQVFDQYQMMRPQMLNDWTHHKLHYDTLTEKWQQALWVKLIAQTGDEHRGELWLKAIAKFNESPEGTLSKYLPERISIVGLNTMPPLFMAFLQGLSRHTEVHFYLLNPAEEFWADIVSRKQANLDDFENGHPLLASLGQQGREFQQMLLEQAFNMEIDSFEQNSLSKEENADENSLSVLQHLQNDILKNRIAGRSLALDSSLSIHSCHSRMREVEVLKEQLLHALEQDAELELRDIIVMAPDIQQYAPFINAVFNGIQHSIADRSLRSSNATLDAYIRFLRLTQGRFGWQSVLDLLNQKEIYQCFHLTETDVELIRHWIAETHVRWGQSGEHKASLDLPESPENTWLAGLERLLMGYAVGTDETFFEDILPYKEIEGTSSQALGGLYDFIVLLFEASKALANNYSLTDWSEKLLYYADLLFPTEQLDATQLAEKQQINSILLEPSIEFAEIHSQPVSLEVILAWLEGRVEESKSSNGFLRGQLTFCSMLPMRSIPFKIIAMLGMNEGEFPHVDHYLTFDLLGKDFKMGDRSRRADDRYQFLEILLSVRKQLIITYIGQSISENETIPASVVVHELLDIMQAYYQIDDLVIEHPLQNFSNQYFAENTSLISYNQTDLAIAQALLKKSSVSPLWWQGNLPAERLKIIETADVFDFYRHPQGYFLEKKLNIRLKPRQHENPEHEPFKLEGIEQYNIDQKWIKALLQGENLSLDKLKAQGLWVSGGLADLMFNQKQMEINAFVDKINAIGIGNMLEPQAIDINLAGVRLVGYLSNCYQNGSLFYRHAKIKGKDFMGAWLHHLIINRVSSSQTTYLITKDAFHTFKPEDIDSESLDKLIDCYQQGQHHPDAFFTEAAFAYIQQQAALNNPAKKSKRPAIKLAKEALQNSMTQEHEVDLRVLYRSFEAIDEVLNVDFEQYCQQYLLPVWEKSL